MRRKPECGLWLSRLVPSAVGAACLPYYLYSSLLNGVNAPWLIIPALIFAGCASQPEKHLGSLEGNNTVWDRMNAEQPEPPPPWWLEPISSLPPDFSEDFDKKVPRRVPRK